VAKGSKRRRKPTAREVQDLERHDALKVLLEELGWTITVSRTLDGPGGDCVVRGARRVIVSGRLGVPERIGLMAEAACREDLGAVFVRPDLRELIEAARTAGRPGAEIDE